jgi:hypothetical protein
MAKGIAAPPSTPSLLEPTTCLDRRASSSLASPLTARKIFRQPSLLSTAFPYLRRLDTGDDPGCRQLKSPLLSLKLSSVSFLNSTVNDGLSRGPLYTIETVGSSTSISRTDPWGGSVKTADIRWPSCVPTKSKWKDMDGVLIQMRGGRWKTGTDILKASNILRYFIPRFIASSRAAIYSPFPAVVNSTSRITLTVSSGNVQASLIKYVWRASFFFFDFDCNVEIYF